MIEMRRAGQLDLTKLLQFEQDVQQRHRVRATRKRAQDAASIVQQPIPPDRPENRIEQLHPVWNDEMVAVQGLEPRTLRI